MNKEKDNPQQQMQDLFSQMVSQTSGMFSPMDPLGAMKPLQQVAEAWTKNPQQFADAMQDWTQQIGDMNTRIWQDFLDRQKENDSKENQSAELADLPYFTWIREYYKTYTNWMEQQIRDTSGVSEKIKEDASFWSKQMLSALSPNNYFWTNPEAINAFIESKGETFPTSPGFASITKLTRTGWSSKFGIPVVFQKKSKRMRVSGPSRC